jgi:N-acetylglucosamine malate deacetylase 2
MQSFWERFLASLVLSARVPMNGTNLEYLIDACYETVASERTTDGPPAPRQYAPGQPVALGAFVSKAKKRFSLPLLAALAFVGHVSAQEMTSPSVLFVAAHPDDESCSSATIYRIAKELGGTADEVIITNGEGGYRYSALANVYYGLNLTEEAVGRARLPEIRKQEVLNAGRILGVRRHFFLNQRDLRYTNDVNEGVILWNSGLVRAEIRQILSNDHYDYVFVLFPTADTHGHHKAAAVLALEAVRDLPGPKPVVLGCQPTTKADAESLNWSPLEGFPIASVIPRMLIGFDRARKFGFKSALSYQVIANWEIAEHKSQGLFQTEMNKYDLEMYAIFTSVDADAADRVRNLFARLEPFQVTAIH